MKRYEANWESLNSAPVPAWFNEAKLALYIFWGPYSVPAFHPDRKVGYAEWIGGQEYGKEFMREHYGEGFIYEDFADMWKGEFWDPEAWADLFVKSGAKYIIIVAKYHDGFCLFPTEYDNRTLSRDKWNSIDRGPKRDILGEIFAAGEKRGLKMGLYMTIYEWFHPLWHEDRKRYAQEVLHPQFKELITRYKPWFVFMDGDWEDTTETFDSAELVAWLLNDSPVKDRVVFNDRWGQSRGVNGMIYNTEFGGGEGCEGHAWQEDRSICPSYGYNRNLRATEYDTPEQTIAMLVKCASNGGNLILGVGPAADGFISVIYEERLTQLGEWLVVNGEAIYGSTAWKVAAQGENIRFTQKDGNLYAICLAWPGKELVLQNVTAPAGARVEMLGHDQPLTWKQQENDLHITIPQLTVDQLPCRYTWTIKIPGAA